MSKEKKMAFWLDLEGLVCLGRWRLVRVCYEVIIGFSRKTEPIKFFSFSRNRYSYRFISIYIGKHIFVSFVSFHIRFLKQIGDLGKVDVAAQDWRQSAHRIFSFSGKVNLLLFLKFFNCLDEAHLHYGRQSALLKADLNVNFIKKK